MKPKVCDITEPVRLIAGINVELPISTLSEFILWIMVGAGQEKTVPGNGLSGVPQDSGEIHWRGLTDPAIVISL